MLEALQPGLERHHRIRISREALEAAVDLSRRYLPAHFLPDKAVDVLDEAAARTGGELLADRTETARQTLNRELSQAVRENRFEQAASIRDKLQQLLRQQRGILAQRVVDREDVAQAVALRTGIPVGKVTQSDRARLLGLRAALSGQVLGQEKAVAAVAEAVCRGRMGLADEKRPVASLLFLGPTGVGKTALCKAWPTASTAAGTPWTLDRVLNIWSSTPCPGCWSAAPATWATARAVSSPSRSGGGPMRWCCWTSWRRPTGM